MENMFEYFPTEQHNFNICLIHLIRQMPKRETLNDEMKVSVTKKIKL